MRFRQRGKLSHHRKNCPSRPGAATAQSNADQSATPNALANGPAATSGQSDTSQIEEQKQGTWGLNLRNPYVGMVEARAAAEDNQQLMYYNLVGRSLRRSGETTDQLQQQLTVEHQQQRQSQLQS